MRLPTHVDTTHSAFNDDRLIMPRLVPLPAPVPHVRIVDLAAVTAGVACEVDDAIEARRSAKTMGRVG